MLSYLATAWPFATLTDGEVVVFAYVGMVATLAALVFVPFKLGRMQRRPVLPVDPTAAIIAGTGKALDGYPAGDPFGVMSRLGAPNLPGGRNA